MMEQRRKPADRAIRAYHATLERLRAEGISNELSTRHAFQTLLESTSATHGWLLIPEQAMVAGGRRIVPDGTLRDEYTLGRGYWEAKDTDHDLYAEIRKKIASGYPLSNTIFEDSRTAVLYQGGRDVFRVDLGDPIALADLLDRFYSYREPNLEEFHQAVDDFKSRVPDLARGLARKIEDAHRHNERFGIAFAKFFHICRTALNPEISQQSVDEMLIQHLLTERLIRTIFDNPDFSRQNIIANEIELVIAALVSESFNRAEFLRSLDRFYVAIEAAARGINDFAEKQIFLNTIYERFFQGYSA